MYCKLQTAMEYVFGSTFVCKTVDAAKEVRSFLALFSSRASIQELDSTHGGCPCFGDGMFTSFIWCSSSLDKNVLTFTLLYNFKKFFYLFPNQS